MLSRKKSERRQLHPQSAPLARKVNMNAKSAYRYGQINSEAPSRFRSLSVARRRNLSAREKYGKMGVTHQEQRQQNKYGKMGQRGFYTKKVACNLPDAPK